MNKKANITLYVLISIVLSFMLISAAVGAIKKYQSKEPDNKEKLSEFVEIINGLQSEDGEANQSLSLRLNTKELFLFYSTGNKDIVLSDKGSGESDETHNIIFKRPQVDECKNKACVCYCSQGQLWNRIKDEPYIKISSLFEKTESYEETNYTYECFNPTCQKVSKETTIFANARGTEEFNEQREDLVDDYNDGGKTNLHDDEYFPIPLDIVSLLALPDVVDDGNIFFSGSAGDDYNRYEQNDYLDEIDSFYWRGAEGIVIGGLGYAKTKSDEKNKRLVAPIANIKFQKPYNGNTIGICLNMPTCLTKEYLDILSKKEDSIETKSTFNRRIKYLKSQTNEFSDCYTSATTDNERVNCVIALGESMKIALKETPSGEKPRISFTGNALRQETLVSYEIGAVNYDSFEMPFKVPYIYKNKELQIMTTDNYLELKNNLDININGYQGQFKLTLGELEETGEQILLFEPEN